MTRAVAGVATFVGSSPAACLVRAQVAAFAACDSPALILGASGSGKEVVARSIHQASARRSGPFVAVDCGAVSDGVVDSELFGHLRGAYSSAIGPRRGLISEAHRGTLFLDEVGNASPAFQARLLRVLESHEVRPVGSDATHGVDLRVVAATNRDLDADVAVGKFREDLLWRLDVLRMQLPTLAERRQDIPELTRHLLARLGERTATDAGISPEALAVLAARDWPGNVRELRSVLERGLALARGGVIGVEHLRTRRQAGPGPAAPRAWAEFRSQQERAFLLNALVAHGWNRTQTARSIGMSRQSLHERLRCLGLRPTLVSPQPTEVHD